MPTHEEKVLQICNQLKSYKGTKPLSLKKKVVSHEVPKPGDKRRFDEKVDVSSLTSIIKIDPEKKICIAESGVTFVDVVKACLPHGLAPFIVPEFKTITIGGAVAGCSIESMSYRVGGFHDTCLEYEVITADGDVLICTPENENQLVFQMVHGTFGTLGIISQLTFRLTEAKPFVHVRYEQHSSLESYNNSIYKHFKTKDVDFMDGIIHSPTEYSLAIGNYVDKAPYSNKYEWLKVYYKTTKTRKEDYLKTLDYFFRYDQGVTNVGVESFIGRLFLGKLFSSSSKLNIAKKLHWLLPEKAIPITVDLFVPFKKMTKFMDWYQKEVNYFPLWCVPYKPMRDYEWIDDNYMDKIRDELFIDLAIYGMKKSDDKDYYKIIEDGLKEIGCIKTLISTNYYTEDDFWKLWNKRNFDEVKAKTDPKNLFRNLYTKTCRAMRGLD